MLSILGARFIQGKDFFSRSLANSTRPIHRNDTFDTSI